MGQKTHPTGFRVGIIQNWASTWVCKMERLQNIRSRRCLKLEKFVKKKNYMLLEYQKFDFQKSNKIQQLQLLQLNLV